VASLLFLLKREGKAASYCVPPYIPHICERISPEFPAGRLDQR
jgi:hypothetical protein